MSAWTPAFPAGRRALSWADLGVYALWLLCGAVLVLFRKAVVGDVA